MGQEMGKYKGPTEGGSGGKRGHSGMEHWTESEEVKEASRKHRRKNDRKESDRGVRDYIDNEDSDD
jgi:hypothetical protein